MIIVAYAPPILTEPFYTAVAQIRANASAAASLLESMRSSETMNQTETSATKTK
jgi:hypothetical protein